MSKIIYNVEIGQLKKGIDAKRYQQYKFNDLGYIVMHYKIVGSKCNFYHGFITPSQLKTIIGTKRYEKFCGGQRKFIL